MQDGNEHPRGPTRRDIRAAGSDEQRQQLKRDRLRRHRARRRERNERKLHNIKPTSPALRSGLPDYMIINNIHNTNRADLADGAGQFLWDRYSDNDNDNETQRQRVIDFERAVGQAQQDDPAYELFQPSFWDLIRARGRLSVGTGVGEVWYPERSLEVPLLGSPDCPLA